MSLFTTRPVKEIDEITFKTLVQHKPIVVSPHATDHLSTMQRKVFKEQELIDMVVKESPRKIYLQENARYGIYFRRKDGYRKLIIDIQKEKVNIISFMDPKELPKIDLEK